MKKTFYSIAYVAIITLGTISFIGCGKENNSFDKLNSETTVENSKSVDDLYNSILSENDFSISIQGDSVNITGFGKINEDFIAVKEYVDGVLHEGLRSYIDENPYQISKIDNNKAELHVENLTSDEYKIIFDEISQHGDTVNFQLKCNDTHIANCTLKLPQNTGVFMDMLPMSLNNNSKAVHVLVAFAVKKLVPLAIAATVYVITSSAEECYENHDKLARTCENGFISTHTFGHFNCKFECK